MIRVVNDFFLRNFNVDFKLEFKNNRFKTLRDIIKKIIKF